MAVRSSESFPCMPARYARRAGDVATRSFQPCALSRVSPVGARPRVPPARIEHGIGAGALVSQRKTYFVTPAPSASSRLATALGSRRRAATRSSAGDAAAFAAVYERHHQALYRYCRSILHHDHDAQDALQSTMTRAFAALRDEPRDIEMRPWLYRIAHNEAISVLRRRRTVDELDDLETRDAPVEEQVSLRADLQHLRQDLEALPERQHAALVLRELNGLSHTEIAQVLDCTPSSVKQSIYEARTGLMHAREGRELACDTVRRTLSDGDGRVLRGARTRAHLRSCSSCRRFQRELVQRPRELAMLAPPLPAAAGAALIAQLLPASGAATAGMLTASSAAGTLAALAPKVVATIAVVVTAAGGTAAVRHRAPAAAPQRAADARAAATTTPPRTPYAADDGAAAGPAPATREHDFPIKFSQPAAGTRGSKGRERARGSGRRTTRTPAQARTRARGRTAPPRRHPKNAVRSRGRSQRPPVPRPATGPAPGRRSSPPGRATPHPHPARANGRRRDAHPRPAGG
jgi:RNA polymerase sigma factor (sigma-70 family)